MAIMNEMIAGKIPRIKRKMGKTKLKIIEVEMEITMVECERSSNAPKEMEEPLENEADPIVAKAQMMKRKFTSSATAEKRKKSPKKNQCLVLKF
jgi:hypothetical protein